MLLKNIESKCECCESIPIPYENIDILEVDDNDDEKDFYRILDSPKLR